jgi:hypothetical protein
VDPAPVPLDGLAGAIEAYAKLDNQIREWSRMRDSLRKQIERELGEADTGTIKGRNVVRWTHYTQRRLLASVVREKFSEAELADCWSDEPRRKFYLLDTS